MATFAAESGIPIALDESLNGVAGDRWLRDWEGPLVVKAALMGDPNRLIARLRPRASQVVLSSVFETGVGLANTLQVADALPEINQPIGFDTSNFGDMLNLSLTQPVLSLEGQARIPTKELWKQLPDCD
jgi:O-succinylbenzoate synthase